MPSVPINGKQLEDLLLRLLRKTFPSNYVVLDYACLPSSAEADQHIGYTFGDDFANAVRTKVIRRDVGQPNDVAAFVLGLLQAVQIAVSSLDENGNEPCAWGKLRNVRS